MMFENSKILFSPPPYDKSTSGNFKKGVCGSLVVLLVIMSLFLCVGCKKKSPTPTTLANPVLTWSSPYFRWDEVPGADKYEVVLNDEVIYTYNNYIEITSRGTYAIKVKSISDSAQFNNSGFSNVINTEIGKVNYVSCWELVCDDYVRFEFELAAGFNNIFEHAEFISIDINGCQNIVTGDDLIIVYVDQSNAIDYYYIDYLLSLDCFVSGKNVVKIQICCVDNYYLSSQVKELTFTISK